MASDRLRFLALALTLTACDGAAPEDVDGGARDASEALADAASPDAGRVDEDAGRPPAPTSVSVRVVPNTEASGVERVSFALPLAPGALSDASRVVVRSGAEELAASRLGLARWPDGSLRSVRIQVELPASEAELTIEVGATPGTAELDAAPVADTLQGDEPRVWVLVPPAWLASSGVLGPLVAESELAPELGGAWDGVCDYERHDTDAFLPGSDSRAVWLFDRVTAMYRGHARTGARSPLRSAYREATLYREGITETDRSVRIGVPGAERDLKYHYTQGMALHYLLTGDERYREAVEAVADRVAEMWTSPGYAGGSDFWTERHAGFALLAYVWAAIVSDDRAEDYVRLAEASVDAYLDIQATYPEGYGDPDARCFAHHANAHGEGYGYFGCSPWMSAILADGLHAYAALRGGAEAERVHASLVQLGRIVARDGRDASGKPFYFMGVGTDEDEPDRYDEHWGESAYLVAMAWHLDGREDASLRTIALELLEGLRAQGRAPHVRSFNWQCRSAVATPYFLR